MVSDVRSGRHAAPILAERAVHAASACIVTGGGKVPRPAPCRTSRRPEGRAPLRPSVSSPRRLLPLLLLGFILHNSSFTLFSYPPAPSHIIYGTLRDEYGTPVPFGAEVLLESASGVKISTTVNPGIEPGANYRLEVPMDTGLLASPYQPTALQPTVPFRLKVRVGGVTYLPIEMRGDFAQLGQPGQRTRLNLTLGEDTDGDGLPDAWERLIDADLAKVNPGDIAVAGMTFQQVYHAGTYTVDPTNGFALNIISFTNGAPVLEFLAITGRTYTLLGSGDVTSSLTNWTPMTFKFPGDPANAAVRQSYLADSIKRVQVLVPSQGDETRATYFRLMLR